MTISEKVAYLKGLAEGLNLDTEKSKEGKLISVMIGILEELPCRIHGSLHLIPVPIAVFLPFLPGKLCLTVFKSSL